MKVAEIMSSRPITIGMDDSLRKIQELFQQHRFHHLMVVSGGRLRGVISDRDVLRRLSPFLQTAGAQRRDEATLELHAHQIMTRHPITVTPETDSQAAARVLIENSISCLPVVGAGDELVGVVTWKDLLRATLAPSAAPVTPLVTPLVTP
jgi:acetoin utilization protein AcuB